jgi:DNA processing protein
MALGIDAAAHRGAIGVGGLTIAVVATGLDVTYPRQHHDLERRIRAHGLVVSEAPFGEGPQRWAFPVRNRIIAMLSDALVVVESKERGGSLETARIAMELGTMVLAMPGSRRNPSAAGTNRLIADGAYPLLEPADVVMAMGAAADARGWRTPPAVPMSADATALLAALAGDPATLDQLAERCGLRAAAAAGAIRELERAGRIVRERGLIWPK